MQDAMTKQLGDPARADGGAARETPSFEQFEADAKRRGFDEVLVREWQPGQIVGEHAHPFAADALVVAGEMWLTVGADTQHLLAGDTFALARDVPHRERYGPDGATYWVARRIS